MMNKTATSIVCFMSGVVVATCFFVSLLVLNDITAVKSVLLADEQHFTTPKTTKNVEVVVAENCGNKSSDGVVVVSSGGGIDGFGAASSSSSLKEKKNDPLQRSFDGIDAIAFPRKWPDGEMPCIAPNDSNRKDTNWKSKEHTRTGLMFVKPLKVGGSSVSGAAVRINHRVASRRSMPFRACKGRYHHSSPVNDFRDRIGNESFLFSWLRDPVRRVTSEFFHFQVSRGKVEPTDDNFQRALVGRNDRENERNFSPSLRERLYGLNFENYYVTLHHLSHTGRSSFREITNETEMRAMVNENIRKYDFFGITERMDESIVVLQMLLGLATRDVLFLNAKTNGNFDDGVFSGKCFYIVPSYLSPGMKEFFRTEPMKKRGRWDRAFYDAMNRSLDLTIDETLGRDPFEEQLKKFRFAQRSVAERCASNVTFPCSAGGKKAGPGGTDCLWHDASCGNDCIDRVVESENL